MLFFQSFLPFSFILSSLLQLFLVPFIPFLSSFLPLCFSSMSHLHFFNLLSGNLFSFLPFKWNVIFFTSNQLLQNLSFLLSVLLFYFSFLPLFPPSFFPSFKQKKILDYRCCSSWVFTLKVLKKCKDNSHQLLNGENPQIKAFKRR